MVEFNPVSSVPSEITAPKKGAAGQQQGSITIEFKSGGDPAAQDKKGNYNTYGKDIANFGNFKGNDKNDAMRITNDAARDVKKAFMQLQHEMPDINLSFEEMPDPNKSGKKREGFFNYQQQLRDWKDIALQQISDAREKSTKEVVNKAAGAIIMNDNINAAQGRATTIATGEAVAENDNINAATTQAVTIATGETIIEKQEKNTKNIQRTIRDAAGGITKQVQISEENLHVHVQNANAATNKNIDRVGNLVEDTTGDLASQANRNKEEVKDHVTTDGNETRKAVDTKGNEVIDTLDPLGTNRVTKKIRDKIANNAGTILGGIIGGPTGAVVGNQIDSNKNNKQPKNPK